MACPLASERVWLDKHQYDAAERRYYETLSGAKLQENGMKVEPAVAPVAPVPEKAPQPSGESKKPNKKNKNQKNKQLNKQSESVQSVEEEPVQAAPKVEEKTSSNKKKKAKKPANKEKAATDEANVQIRETVEVKVVAEEPPKTKEGKEKKNKADKKKANNNKAAEEPQKGAATPAGNTLVSEIAKARQHIKDSLERMDGIAALASTPGAELLDRLATVERENSTLRQTISKLENLVLDLTKRVNKLEGGSGAAPKPVAAAPAAASKDDDDDGVDLFASDEEEEDAAAAKVREERLAAYNAKKSKKPVLIAKSNLILDVKCWDDETDMKELEAAVRGVTCEGLLWGASKLVPLAYGIQKLQISCVVEDEKVSIDWLVDEIQAHEDFVQSVDIAAFNKI